MSSPLSSASASPATVQGLRYSIVTYGWEGDSFLFAHGQGKTITEIAVDGIVFNNAGGLFCGKPRNFRYKCPEGSILQQIREDLPSTEVSIPVELINEMKQKIALDTQAKELQTKIVAQAKASGLF